MQLRMVTLFLLFAIPSIGLSENPNADGWLQWRGPSQNGQAGLDAKPPTQWSSTSNIQWVADISGEGTATPIVLKNSVYIVSAEATDRKSDRPTIEDERSKTIPPNVFYRFHVTSFDRTTGKVQWNRVAIEQVPHEGHHDTHTYAGGSPTSDGERLYVSFASRGIFCYSLDGELLWKTDLGDMRTRFGWGDSVTPVLADDALIVNWDQEEGSFIVALDKRTGQELWRTSRAQEVTTWNTPLVIQNDGKTIIVVNGTDRVRAYDAKNGKELWSCGGQTVNAIPSPVRFEDTVICISGYRGALGVAIPIQSHGDVTDSNTLRWKITQGTPYVPSPALSNNRLIFTGGNNGILTCIDAKSGKSIVDRKRINGLSNIYASPLVANGKIYLTGRDGTTVVLKDDNSFETLAVNSLEGTFDASPVAVSNQLFLRSWKKLYCISEGAK